MLNGWIHQGPEQNTGQPSSKWPMHGPGKQRKATRHWLRIALTSADESQGGGDEQV